MGLNLRRIVLWGMPILILASMIASIYMERARKAGWITYDEAGSGLVGNSVNVIAFDDQGRAWAGTSGSGVSVFDGETWTTYDIENSGLTDNNIRSIAFDGQGRAWIGTSQSGVSVFDGETWTTRFTSRIGINPVEAIAFDDQGRAWLATHSAGVNVFDGEGWIHHDENNSPLSRDAFIRAIAFDAQGRAWIGTVSRRKTTPGFHIFDGETWTTYDTEDSGLAHNHVSSIAFDGQGRAWIGTSRGGISVVSANELAAIAQPLRFLQFFFAPGTRWLLPSLLGALWLLSYPNSRRTLYSITMRSPIGTMLIVLGMSWLLVGSILWFNEWRHQAAWEGPRIGADGVMASPVFNFIAAFITSILPGLIVSGIGYRMTRKQNRQEQTP
jgi:ligand-binding sensor domain-containing protein